MPAIIPVVVGAGISSALSGILTGGIFATTIFSSSVFGSLTVGGLVSKVIGGLVSFGLSKALAPKAKSASEAIGAAGSQGILQIIRSPIEPHKVIYGRRRVSGTLVFATTTTSGIVADSGNDYAKTFINGKKNEFLHLIICLAGHEVDGIETVYLNDQEITLAENGFATNAPFRSDGKSWVYIKKYLGSDDQSADPDLSQAFPDWTSAHRLRGIAYLYVMLRWDENVFPGGAPNVSAIVRGKKVFDPRSSTTYYTNNWALCLLDYISNTKYGLGAEQDNEVDIPTFISAANISDENVTLLSGGTYKRYTLDGIITTDSQPIDVLDSMTSHGAGALVYSEGQFKLFAGAYLTPTITVDNSWLRGEISIKARPGRKDLFNLIKGVYIEPTKLWQATDFPPVTNTLYQIQDGGEIIARDVELPFCINAEQAQRISKIGLDSARQGITYSMEANFKALQLKVWDNVVVNMSQYGWDNKVFKVLGWTSQANGGVDLELKEEASAIYDWNAGNASPIDPAPDTNLPSPFTIDPPGAPQVTEELYVTSTSSGIKVRAIVTWAPSPGPFVRFYQVEFRPIDSDVYRVIGTTPDTTLRVDDVQAGVYEVRVKAINTVDAASAYASSIIQIFGLSTPPQDITNFSVNDIGGAAHLSWDASPDLDVKIGGAIRIKYSPALSGASWSESVDIGPRLSGTATNASLPLLTGTYLIKAIDSSGNESENASLIVTNVANILGLNVIVTEDQQPTFLGMKTGLVVDGSVLKLDGSTLFDDVSGDFDDAPGLFDDFGDPGQQTLGIYEFDDTVDLDAVYTVRISALVAAVTYNPLDTFDERVGLFDDQPGMFDGEDLTGIEVIFYIRTTDDDPSGSPVWSDWRRFFVGDYTGRAFQFKIEVVSEASNLQINISELSISVDVPDRTERDNDVVISSGGSTISFSNPFFTKPVITFSVQALSTGDYYTYTLNSSGGKYVSFTFQVFNSSATGISKTIDWIAQGH